tara:strand:+ start:708 stop:1466 length:759 start_codon:yes stop_codon:yes gene_type:complete
MNEISVREDAPVFSHLNSQMAAITELGTAIAKSGFAGCDRVEQGVIIAFTCLAEKITPIEFSRTYDIIHGQPTKKASVMLAEFRNKYGGDFDWLADGEDGKTATIQLTYRGKEKNPVSFSIKEAQAKGLAGKTNYKQHLPEMLRARATTKALRMYVPEIAAGIYDPYEIDASQAVEKLMSKPEPTTQYLDNLKSLLKERPPEIQTKAIEIIKKRFKVSELDSLNENQAGKVVQGWESFMNLPEFGNGEAPQA